MVNKEKKRYYWADILKILACFLVIINHTGGYLLQYSGYDNLGIIIFYIINFAICKIAVPIFIMVSGFLLLQRENKYLDIVKRIFRILVPLLFLSMVVFFKKNGIGLYQLKDFIISFLKEPIIVPFWYLYMLIGLYLVTPFIQKMIKNFKMLDFQIFILICLIIPSILPIITTYLHVSFNSNFLISILPISVGYYVAGFYLSKIPLNKKYRNLALILFFVFLSIFACSMMVPYIYTSEISYQLDTWNYITTVIPALALFYLFRYYFTNKIFSIKVENIIFFISSLTFGIYLFHTFVNYKIYDLEFMQSLFAFSPYIAIFVLEILTFICAGAITFILKKIKFIRLFL